MKTIPAVVFAALFAMNSTGYAQSADVDGALFRGSPLIRGDWAGAGNLGSLAMPSTKDQSFLKIERNDTVPRAMTMLAVAAMQARFSAQPETLGFETPALALKDRTRLAVGH